MFRDKSAEFFGSEKKEEFSVSFFQKETRKKKCPIKGDFVQVSLKRWRQSGLFYLGSSRRKRPPSLPLTPRLSEEIGKVQWPFCSSRL